MWYAVDATTALFLTCKWISVNLHVTLQIQNGTQCNILNADVQVVPEEKKD